MNITSENWTSSHFYSEPLRAFVSLGAEPIETEAGASGCRVPVFSNHDRQRLR